MPAELCRDLPGYGSGGTLAVSWGANGGFYYSIGRGWPKGFSVRVCLWRVAITYLPRDLDAVLKDALSKRREERAAEAVARAKGAEG